MKKVNCQYCKKPFKFRGLKPHENACKDKFPAAPELQEQEIEEFPIFMVTHRDVTISFAELQDQKIMVIEKDKSRLFPDLKSALSFYVSTGEIGIRKIK